MMGNRGMRAHRWRVGRVLGCGGWRVFIGTWCRRPAPLIEVGSLSAACPVLPAWRWVCCLRCCMLPGAWWRGLGIRWLMRTAWANAGRHAATMAARAARPAKITTMALYRPRRSCFSSLAKPAFNSLMNSSRNSVKHLFMSPVNAALSSPKHLFMSSRNLVCALRSRSCSARIAAWSLWSGSGSGRVVACGSSMVTWPSLGSSMAGVITSAGVTT